MEDSWPFGVAVAPDGERAREFVQRMPVWSSAVFLTEHGTAYRRYMSSRGFTSWELLPLTEEPESGRFGYHLPGFVAIETALLLISSVTFGLAMLRADKQDRGGVLLWLGITGLFGAGFIGMEIYEFNHLIHLGAGPDRSAFLSSFFALVGTHGLHVTGGLIWLVTLMVQIRMHGLIGANMQRLTTLSMFWHFLDLIWIGVFSFVYLVRLV